MKLLSLLRIRLAEPRPCRDKEHELELQLHREIEGLANQVRVEARAVKQDLQEKERPQW